MKSVTKVARCSNNEFLAAKTAGDIIRREGHENGVGNGFQHLVAHGMAKLIIDRFEMALPEVGEIKKIEDRIEILDEEISFLDGFAK